MEIAKGEIIDFSRLLLPNTQVLPASFTDTGEIYARLFDHRPFTTAEIQYCLHQFEVGHGKCNFY